MPAVHLFGLRLELSGTSILQPAVTGIVVRTWNGSFDARRIARLRTWLEVAGTHTLQIQISVPMIERTAGEWFPTEGVHPQDGSASLQLWDQLFTQLPAAPVLFLDSGCLRLQQGAFPGNGVVGASGNLGIRIPSGSLVQGLDLPLSIFPAREGRFSLDLSNRQILFLAGCFRAETSALFSAPDASGEIETIQFFGREHLSEPLSATLTAPIEPLELMFGPQSVDSGLLPLHADLFDRSVPVTEENPVSSPLAVTGYRLLLGISGATGNRTRLTRVRVAPAGSTFSLLSFALGDSHNERAVWTAQSPLDLHLRAGTFIRPATLLVAPVYRTPDPGLAFRPVSAGPLHGALAESQFRLEGQCRLVCEHRLDNQQPVPGDVAPGIVSELTAPWLELRSTAGRGQRFSRTKPAYAYLGGSPEVVPFDFRGERLALPLVPDLFFEAEGQEVRTRLHGDLNGVFSQLLDEVKDVRHESGLREEPVPGEAALRIRRVFLPPTEEPQQLDLAAYSIERDYGPIKVRQRIDPGASPDYLVLRAGHDSFPRFQQDFPLDPAVPQLVVRREPAEADGRPLGIVKLSRKFSLGEIFDREGLPRTVRGLPGRDFVEDVVDPAIRSREWLGLLLFAVPLGYGNLQILHDLVGEGTLELAYLAVTPAKPGQTDGFSLAGRVLWRNQASAAPGARPADDCEVTFRVNEVDIAWYDSRLTYFHADTDLRFKNFFSVPHSTAEGVLLKILGSYDRERNEIRFLGRLSERLPLLPDDLDFGPIRQVFVRSAEIRVVENDTSVAIDGSIEPRAFGFDGFDWFGSGEGVQVDFRGLQIRIPTAADRGGEAPARAFRGWLARQIWGDFALFADAKAFLFSRMSGSTAGGLLPEDFFQLASEKRIRDGIAGESPLVDRDRFSFRQGLSSLAETSWFGFPEVLDDLRYDNEFVFEAFRLPSFEGVLEQLGAERPDTAGRGAVPLAGNVLHLPGGAQTLGSGQRIEVALASRRPVIAPVHVFTGDVELFQTGEEAGELRPGDRFRLQPLLQGRFERPGQAREREVILEARSPSFPFRRSTRLDDTVVTAIFAIRGDEEAATSWTNAFNNDEFLLDIQRIAAGAAAARVAAVTPPDPPAGGGTLKKCGNELKAA